MNTVISGANLAPFVHGILSLETGPHGVVLHRLPAWARAQVEDRLLSYAEACPTGGVLRFATTAPEITLTLATTVVAAPGTDPRLAELVALGPSGRTSVVVPSPTVLEVSATGVAVRPAGAVEVTIPAAGTVEVHLPHAAHVELVAISATADVVPVETSGLRWTHYGSSISQGMNAVDPTRTWPVQAALSLGWSLTDLAFAGNAQLDPFAARLIRDTPADLITLKVGINLLNADSMRERTFRPALHGFLDTIREGQPETKIAVITALACPIHEHTPGPVVDGEGGMMHAAARSVEPDTGALTLSRTREIIAEVVAVRDDANLALVDGLSLFGLDDTHLLYDDLHPDQAGLDLIAERFVGMAPSLV